MIQWGMEKETPLLFRETEKEIKYFIAGLYIGEGSFTGDNNQPVISLKMHVRHEYLLRRVNEILPYATLYGPYHHQDRHYYLLKIRGRYCEIFLHEYEDIISSFCPHVLARINAMRERYPTWFHAAS